MKQGEIKVGMSTLYKMNAEIEALKEVIERLTKKKIPQKATVKKKGD